MIKEIVKKPNKSAAGSRIALIAALAGTLLAAAAFVCFLFGRVRTAQQNSIMENAMAYSSLMDEKISVDLHGFLELNLDPALESSRLGDFFHSSSGMAASFSDIRNSAAECVEMAENLDDLILYRTSDNTLLSTMSDYHYLAKINPAYPYLMSALAQARGDAPSFVYSSNGSVLYYYPISHGAEEDKDSGRVSDCVIAILHKSEDFLGVDISPSPLATFAVLREGQVLSIEGYNALSQKLVASVAGLAKSVSSVYTYSDANMPDYYFYVVHSQSSELEYCYYEPVLTGYALMQRAFSTWWLAVLILLLAAAAGLAFLIIAASPKKAPQEQQAEAAPEEENLFGTLLNYSGIIIDYYNKNGSHTTPETLKLTDQIIRENFAFNKIYYQASPRHLADCLEYYINYNNYNMRVFCDSLKMNLFNEVPECSINIYYSLPVPTSQEMEDDLFYLHKHLHYSLVLGYGIRLSIQQIQNFEKNTEVLDSDVTGTIQGFLRTGAYDDLYAYLSHYKSITKVYSHSYNFMTWYSFSERYRFAEEAFTTVKLFFQENGFAHPIAHTTCNSVLRAKPGFSNLCEYLISCVQDYQRENQHTLSDHSKQLMNAIYKFIDEDLAGANLNSIARKMQMTDSHLSRMFKKNTGFNFSEYLSERRLEEASKLLLQDTKLKVADISESLGYGNPTYFLSRFKAKYGMSPSAYRKTHLMNRAETSDPDMEKNTD